MAKPTQTTRSSSSTRFDTQFSTGTAGLTNARTRIVGERTGFWADVVVGFVRLGTQMRAGFSRVFGRVAAVVTPLGWVMTVVIPVTLVLGLLLRWEELVVIGAACAVMAVIAVLYLIGRTRVSIALAVPHNRVVVGHDARGELTVRGQGRGRTFGLTVEIPVGDGLVESALPALAHDAEFRHGFAVPTTKRGVIPVGPVRTVRADPIGLVRREVVFTETTEVFVHPVTIGIPSMSTGFVRDLEGSPTRDLSTSDISFHALREYVPGDERRNIHWKSTARTGRYMVRQFEETRRSHLVVALSLAQVDYASDEEFELAVSAAGSLGARAIRDARTVTVAVGERTPAFAKRRVYAVRMLSTITRDRLLDDLAVVAADETSLPLADVARVSAEQAAGASVAFLVCGSTVTPQQLRVASTAFPLGVEIVAVVCAPDQKPGMRRLAGLSVLTIGYLEDLQKSLARSAAL